MFDQTVKFRTQTNGTGYWSGAKKFVTINRVHLAYLDEEDGFGELRAYFGSADWDVPTEGLIYTDKGWMKSFKACLATLGFSEKALDDVDYSEQGMQSREYVSMDVGADFTRECEAMYRFVINQQSVNM